MLAAATTMVVTATILARVVSNSGIEHQRYTRLVQRHRRGGLRSQGRRPDARGVR